MGNATWHKAYAAWQSDCLRELNERFGTELPEDRVEFSEFGSAYVHGIGGTAYHEKTVTPWRDSPHYLPVF